MAQPARPEGGRHQFTPGPPVHRGGPNSVQGPPVGRGGPQATTAVGRVSGTRLSTAGMRGPARQRGGPRFSRHAPKVATSIHTGAACPKRRPKQCPGAACRQRRPTGDDGGRARERDAPVDGADARPYPTEGRAAIRLAST